MAKTWCEIRQIIGLHLSLCWGGFNDINPKEAVQFHHVPVVLPATRQEGQDYDSSKHQIEMYIYHVLYVVPRIVIQDDTEAVDETSMHKQVEAKDEQVSTDERCGKNNDISLQQEYRYTSHDCHSYNETDASNVLQMKVMGQSNNSNRICQVDLKLQLTFAITKSSLHERIKMARQKPPRATEGLLVTEIFLGSSLVLYGELTANKV